MNSAKKIYLHLEGLNLMPASVYESLVKEYLESEGYLVYLNLMLPGRKKELDIVAFSPKLGAIVGEAKPAQPTDSFLFKLGKKFERKKITKYLSERFGLSSFKVVLYCWDMYDEEEEFLRKSKEAGFDEVVTYTQILDSLVKKVIPFDGWFYDVNRPNQILLQLVVDAVKNGSKHFRIENYIR